MIPFAAPRYNPKYENAAVTSLNQAVLYSLQGVTDNGFRTVVLTVLSSLSKRPYPEMMSAEVTARTLRRFFEHAPTAVDCVCLCVDEKLQDSYREQLALYFPRSAAEAAANEARLPADVGDEWGKGVQSEKRAIRISALPGMGEDDDAYDDYYDEAEGSGEVVVGATPQVSELVSRQEDPDKRATQGVDDPKSPNYVPPAYLSIAARASTLDTRALDETGFLSVCGEDPATHQQIALFVGQYYAAPAVTRDQVAPYMSRVLDTAACAPYTLVYLHSPLTNSAASMAWLHDLAASFPRRFVANMRLAVVYPTFWLKTHIRFARLGALKPIADVAYYNNLAALFAVIGRGRMRIPEELLNADASVRPTTVDKPAAADAKPSATSIKPDDDL